MRVVIAMTLALVAAAVWSMPARAQGGDGKIIQTGLVVCSQCWYEADRTAKPYGTESDISCAIRCARSGIPSALAVAGDGGYTVYVLERGAFERASKDFSEYVGKRVTVSGTERSEDEKRYLRVDTLAVAEAVAQTAPAEATLPAEAPELELADLSGAKQRLGALAGRIVVLHCWATWCVPCRKEMPAFVKLQNEFAAWGVQVVAASADDLGARDQVVKFVHEQKLNFPVWVGASVADMERFGLGQELPGTVIVDANGKVVARFRGVVREADLRKHVERLVAERRTEAGALARHEPGHTAGGAARVPS
jgi:thiol-disulfide isomerase/thioredoxin